MIKTGELLHIYGPFSLQWYGLMIFIGIIIFIYALYRDCHRQAIISMDKLFDIISMGLLVGLAGARFLYIASNPSHIKTWLDLIAVWDGGLSLLGAVIAIGIFGPLYMMYNAIEVLPLLDLVCVYAPFLQSIARIGCFFAGCCYGAPCNGFWAINGMTDSGVCMRMHPTQLYSAMLLFLIFLIMKFLECQLIKKQGQLIMVYLMLTTVERFCIDFFRGDREMVGTGFFGASISLHQLIACALFMIALILLIVINLWASKHYESV